MAAKLTTKELIRRAMSELGKRKSKKKADAARENGKKGGRPKNPTPPQKRNQKDWPNLCSRCKASVTSADFSAGLCTNCQHALR